MKPGNTGSIRVLEKLRDHGSHALVTSPEGVESQAVLYLAARR